MAITAQDVNKLRKMTGMGMMDCKKALTEANGDFDKAIEILRKKGEKISAKRADNETKEGVVLIHNNDNGTESTIVAINCETESVAKNDEFNQLANTVLEKAVSEKPADTEALLAIEVEGKAIQEHITQFMGKVGEKIIVSAYERVSGEAVIPYLHNNGKLGVLVALKGVNGAEVEEAGKDVAMQIAAMNPIAVDKEGVPTDLVEKEIEIGKEQARNEGKPEDLVEKIALGKLNRFYKDNTLLNQAFVKDGSKTVAKMLQEINKELTVVDFKRVAIA